MKFNESDLRTISPAALKAGMQTTDLFADRRRLTKRVLRTLGRHRRLDRWVWDGKTARTLLAERLAELPLAEFHLLAGFILADELPGLRESEMFRWWQVIRGDVLPAEQEN
jgi:hypothetical protein